MSLLIRAASFTSQKSSLPLKLTANDLMRMEVGELPRFEFEEKHQEYWISLAGEVLQVEKQTPNLLMSSRSKSHQDSMVLGSDDFQPQRQTSQQNRRQHEIRPSSRMRNSVPFSTNLIKDEDKKTINMHSSALWNARLNHRAKNALKRNRSIKPVEPQEQVKFRRKSTQGIEFGFEGRKMKQFRDIDMEVNMHRKKKMANMILENLRQNKHSKSLLHRQRKKIKMMKEQNEGPKLPQIVQEPILESKASLALNTDNSQNITDEESVLATPTNSMPQVMSQKDIQTRHKSKYLTVNYQFIFPKKSIARNTIYSEAEQSSKKVISPQRKITQEDIKNMCKPQLFVYQTRPRLMNLPDLDLDQHNSQNSSVARQPISLHHIRHYKSESSQHISQERIQLPQLSDKNRTESISHTWRSGSKTRDLCSIYVQNSTPSKGTNLDNSKIRRRNYQFKV